MISFELLVLPYVHLTRVIWTYDGYKITEKKEMKLFVNAGVDTRDIGQ